MANQTKTKKDNQYSFLAQMGRWVVDGDGEAKLTLLISKDEARKMAELSAHDGELLQVAVIVLPENEIEKKSKDEDPSDDD